MFSIIQCTGYAATDAHSPLAPFSFTRRTLRPFDVAIEIVYCGVCHSDLHYAGDDWARTVYPCVPGHEIVGRVTDVGAEVTRFKSGDRAAVGCMVDSCRDCSSCASGLEQYCNNRLTATYNGKDRQTGEPTFGGYSDRIIVTQDFVLRIPEGLDLERVAPLLCAGITTYSPLRHWRVGPGQKVGVGGLGGLGHMGVKLAHAQHSSSIVPPPRASAPRPDTKLSGVITLLERKTGATIDELIAATGWLPHTTRAAMTGLRKRGFAVTSERQHGAQTTYRIAPAPAAQAA